MQLKWQKPDVIPVVQLGEEKQFWVAIEVKGVRMTGDHVKTFLAQYQNRPFDQEKYDNNVDEFDDCLVDVDGEFVSSVGWVHCQTHVEFENFYEPFNFSDDYKLLGWAEYTAPEFPPFND